MTKGMLSITNVRRKFLSWRAEKKMRAEIRKQRHQFKRTYKLEVKETGETLDDFDVVKILGKGSFGQVKLIRSKRSNVLSALKVMDRRGLKRIILEIKLMKSMNHPFIVGMRGHFSVGDKVYLEMPYYPCGDLYELIKSMGECSKDLARFYGAQLVMGIDFMHSIGVMHRDLKPKNIMIEADGYIKIVDLGLSTKSDTGRQYTICGTTQFMAPEMFLGMLEGRVAYMKYVDWWSYGITMFNILTGEIPFPGEFSHLKIMSGSIDYPMTMDQDSREYLEAQLQVYPENRLGCGKEGAREIMKHPWFRGVDWTGLFFKKVKAPYIPEVWAGKECPTHKPMNNSEAGAPNYSVMNYFPFMDDHYEDGGDISKDKCANNHSLMNYLVDDDDDDGDDDISNDKCAHNHSLMNYFMDDNEEDGGDKSRDK